MSTPIFRSFHVKRYRSLMDVKLEIGSDQPTIICGENNIGKTNFLRAMNVYFNHSEDDSLVKPEEDIPHHIFYGSRGGSANIELIASFEIDGKQVSQKVTFKNDGTVLYHRDKAESNFTQFREIAKQFRFMFVESNNINLPSLISQILETDGLLALDKKRAKQSNALEKLQEFISSSQKAVDDIQSEMPPI